MIRDRSWSRGITRDPFVGEVGSYQYSENCNTFDDLRGIKLSNAFLTTAGLGGQSFCFPFNDNVNATDANRYIQVQISNGAAMMGDPNSGSSVGGSLAGTGAVCFASTVFAGKLWQTLGVAGAGGLRYADVSVGNGFQNPAYCVPRDFTMKRYDAPIYRGTAGTETPRVNTPNYGNAMGVVNNKVLLVGNGNFLWSFNPQEAYNVETGQTVWDGSRGWKVVAILGTGMTIKHISVGWEYSKIYITNGQDVSIWYYQNQFDMEATGLMNEIKLYSTTLKSVYPFTTEDVIGISNPDSSRSVTNVQIGRLNGYDFVPRFKEKKALVAQDNGMNRINHLVGPLSSSMGRYFGTYYFADAYGVYEAPDGNPVPRVNRRREIYDETGNGQQPGGLCIAGNWIIVNYANGNNYRMRLADSGIDDYASQGLLISRVIETEYGGEFTKQLKGAILQYEFNENTTNAGRIELYVSFNRRWTVAKPTDSERILMMTVDSGNATDYATMTKKMTKLASSADAWRQDFQTIEYMIVLYKGGNGYTPIVRSVILDYELKDKTIYF